MKRICPNPTSWNDAFTQLTMYSDAHPCMPPSPPKPLILSGWAYSNDVEKKRRWEKTVAWATDNGCIEIVMGISQQDFYFVSEPTTYATEPAGGPMYLPWNFDRKLLPPPEDVARYFEMLRSRWSEIVGPELSHITCPLAFTGEKARRLLVQAEGSASPPWGGWTSLSPVETERRTFTRLRAALNNAITPHEIDHIDFTTDVDEPIIPPGLL